MSEKQGLTIPRYFTQAGVNPFDRISWELRTAAITDEKGKIFFEQKDVEVPAFWSQMATNVVVQKYFRGTLGTPERENSVRQLIGRVVDTITEWGTAQRYFRTNEDAATFKAELIYLLVNQHMSFNSPVWFNVGVEKHPQCSACFINSVDDTMESILSLAKTEGMLFKYGSGTGTNFSPIRSSKEKLKGGGVAGGPLPFLRGFDGFAGAIKSGSRTRRAAKMVILNIDHPDIVEYIECKAAEERKAWALIDAGYDGSFTGEAYGSVCFQNSNNSARVTDEFMNAVCLNQMWHTRSITTQAIVDSYRARDLWRKIAEAAHQCGDPGLQFDTTINAWHTCPNTDRINASNPCSEYMFLNDSACNLASLNLRKFQYPAGHARAGDLDIEAFERAVELTILAQEIIVDNSRYPTEKIAKNSFDYRPLGLGYANLGAFLMARGLPYDSDEARAWAGGITALMTGCAYLQSAKIAAVKGPFDGYAANAKPFIEVMKYHRHHAALIPEQLCPNLKMKALAAWRQTIVQGGLTGFRNSQVTVLAPTGTIGFMMDCDTTGVEPDIALVKYKRLVGGGMLKIVNGTVEEALRKLGYHDLANDALKYIEAHDTIEGWPVLNPEHLPVFDCAFKPQNGERSISPSGHLRMMAAVQPFLSGAISKTVNLPNSATVEDIENTYMEAWKLGLKAVAVYRDGCKRSQPVSTTPEESSEGVKESLVDRLPPEIRSLLEKGQSYATEKDLYEFLAKGMNPQGAPVAIRHRLPDERKSITHKFAIAGHEGYIHVGMYDDGTPGELFVHMAKEGSTISGLIDSFATAVSLALQHGTPLKVLCDKFRHTRFEPSGMTGNTDIPRASSVMDYIFHWLQSKFLKEETAEIVAERPGFTEGKLPWRQEMDAPACHECGAIMVRSGACHKCLNCGGTSGCS